MQKAGRPGAALVLCGAVLVVPLLLIQNQSVASASPGPGGAHAVDPHADASHPARSAASPGPSTSDVRTPPSPSAGAGAGAPHSPTATIATPEPTAGVPETTLPAQEVARHTAVPSASTQASVSVPPRTTTTTAPIATTTTTTTHPVSVAPTGPVHTGQVTYYAHPAGTCASPWLPFGTVVRITNPANHESVNCLVDDREADTARAIDLSTSTFALIAPLSQGVIYADLVW